MRQIEKLQECNLFVGFAGNLVNLQKQVVVCNGFVMMKTSMSSFRIPGTVVIEIMIGILCVPCITMKGMPVTGKNVRNTLIRWKCMCGTEQMSTILKNCLIHLLLSQPNAQNATRLLPWEKRVTAFQEENTFAKIVPISS